MTRVVSKKPDVRESYDEWHRGDHQAPGYVPPWIRLFREGVLERESLAGRDVLEIGCGRGETALELARLRPRSLVAGDFSISAVAIGEARERSDDESTSVAWLAGDIQSLPFKDETFDWVLSFETIEHIPDPSRALREIWRVLRPGGRLVLTTPSYMNAIGLYRIYLRLIGRRFSEAGQPINRFTSVLRSRYWLRRAGFRTIRFDGVTHSMPLWPGRPALDLSFLERWRFVSRWIAIQTLFLAAKPGNESSFREKLQR